jgi:hypothetical protein
MTVWQAFFMGIFVAYTPCLLVPAIVLWRDMEGRP